MVKSSLKADIKGDAGIHAGLGSARITVDLNTLEKNYRELQRRAPTAEVAAVVKADAYGLGVGPVAGRLNQAGCRTFFVTTMAEGLQLRQLHRAAQIYVLGQVTAEVVAVYVQHELMPVLSTLREAHYWGQQAQFSPAALKVDTGMTRAGLAESEAAALSASGVARETLNITLLMSHLACADVPTHPMNLEQIECFERVRARWPGVPWSLANSAGIFLGARFHGDLVRPGIALYGGRPFESGPNPMSEVVRVQGRVRQIRALATAATVGYGATHFAAAQARIATIGMGYADGYLRSLGDRGFAFYNGHRAPLIGRVSMDSLALDVTATAFDSLLVGDYVDLIGGGAPLEEVAALAGTVNYELLTNLSRRALRVYE